MSVYSEDDEVFWKSAFVDMKRSEILELFFVVFVADYVSSPILVYLVILVGEIVCHRFGVAFVFYRERDLCRKFPEEIRNQLVKIVVLVERKLLKL